MLVLRRIIAIAIGLFAISLMAIAAIFMLASASVSAVAHWMASE